MVTRSASALVAALALMTVAGACTGAAVPAPTGTPVAQAPAPTPVLPGSPAATPGSTPVATPGSTPITGGVDGAIGGPELSIERVDEDTILATIDDPDAKAWRLVISGTGDRADERWEIVVETGDVAPSINATEIRDGQIVDVLDLTGFWDGTGAAGGCHSALPVCLDSQGFELPEGDGRFAVRLDLVAPTPLMVTGGTARWDGEPFVLGPWHDTDAFPWVEG